MWCLIPSTSSLRIFPKIYKSPSMYAISPSHKTFQNFSEVSENFICIRHYEPIFTRSRPAVQGELSTKILSWFSPEDLKRGMVGSTRGTMPSCLSVESAQTLATNFTLKLHIETALHFCSTKMFQEKYIFVAQKCFRKKKNFFRKPKKNPILLVELCFYQVLLLTSSKIRYNQLYFIKIRRHL